MKRICTISIGSWSPARVAAAPAQTVNNSQLSYAPPTDLPPQHPWNFYRPDYVASLSPHTVVGGGIGVGAGAANPANGHGGPGGPGSPGR
jgi:hypothetical protein